MEEMMESMREEMAAQGAAEFFDEMMGGMISEEMISRTSEMGWNQLVGFWVGRTLTVGEPVPVPSDMPLPMAGNQMVTMETELEYLGRTACEESGAGDGCLELQATAAPDADEMRNVMDIFMADMMERMGGTGMEVAITEMELTTVNVLVVEAGTLVPIRMETTTDMDMTMDMMGMSQQMQNRQVVTTRFAWER